MGLIPHCRALRALVGLRPLGRPFGARAISQPKVGPRAKVGVAYLPLHDSLTIRQLLNRDETGAKWWVAQLKPLDIERLISCDKKPATNESKTKLIKKYTQHLTTSDDLLQNRPFLAREAFRPWGPPIRVSFGQENPTFLRDSLTNRVQMGRFLTFSARFMPNPYIHL